ncbi:MAG: glutamine-hydrolyzing GMP synthase, partial [Phycisphaerales bacterium]|nr:glutamine-hydrolyzing GMP synthase [Hyphomonadaceae bacterium]
MAQTADKAAAPLSAAPNHVHERILIIDFGSQVTQLIARRVRENGIYCEIHPYNKVDGAFLKAYAPQALIFSGGPSSVLEGESPRVTDEAFKLAIPILAICYGQQTMQVQLGGKVEGGHAREFGRADVEIKKASPLFDGVWDVGARYPVWMSHGDRVTELAAGFEVIATSENAPFAIAVDETRRFYTTMFHPEVVHTPDGGKLLRNFTHRIAGMKGDWTMAAFKDEAIARIRAQVGDGTVICGLSGGVDSSVAAVLIHEAIGDRLHCVFVDHGLMRKDEATQVVSLFRDHYNIPLIHADESERFLGALEGVSDPEVKRKTIGRLFIDVFEEKAKSIGGAAFLAQGTLYPDVIESVSVIGPSHVIKSHHNVGGLPDRMRFKLIEPLRLLFKDEVRLVGKELGLEDEFVWRQPFPGPGLAVRILGEVTASRLTLVRRADHIVAEEVKRAGWYRRLWQSFAVLLPIQSVGVMGDARTYEYTIAVRAVESRDGMTADWARLPHELLATISSRIVNEVKGINRVV